jgi:hypothetical protein
MQKKNILFLSGIADDRKAGFVRFNDEGVQEYDLYGSCNLISNLRTDTFNSSLLILTPDDVQTINLNSMNALFNQISDADTHRKALLKADNLYGQLPDTIRKFNLPCEIFKTTRDNVSTLLQGIEGLNVPKTIRIMPNSPEEIYRAIENESFVFPVIFRPAGAHAGVGTLLIENKNEAFYPYPLDGRSYYLTQFIDYAQEGRYTKIRLAVVDGKVYIRHCIMSHEWMIHAKNKEACYQEEEHEIIRHFESTMKPVIQPLITEIHERIGLDYFGIDCAIDKEMQMSIFEINANMNILIGATPFTRPYVDLIMEAVVSMIGRQL